MQETYSIRELMERYKCSKSTIFRMMIKEAFPRGGQGGGSRTVISGEAVYEWELEHRPHMHPMISADKQFEMEDYERWRELREFHEGKLAEGIKKPVTPAKGWRDVRREQKQTLDAIHGKIKARRGK